MIRTVIRLPNDMVIVFDEDGEQLPEYQGKYKDVRDSILRDTPQDAIFAHWFAQSTELRTVSREEW